jgi:SAM-dependent methyltransferase
MSSGSAPTSDRPWNHNIQFHAWVLAQVPKSCDRALDVGCGDGLLLPKLAERARHVTGIDLSTEMIALARQKVHTPNVELITGDFLETALPAGGFDFIASLAVIHWMPLPLALSRAAGLLRPGGVLALVGLARSATPTDYAVSAVSVAVSKLVRTRRGWWESPVPRIDPAMTYSEIRNSAEKFLAGVDVRRHLYFRYTLRWRKPSRVS